MPDLVIVDTDVLIDAGRNIGDAVTCLEQVERQASLAISVVSEMELVDNGGIGCQRSNFAQPYTWRAQVACPSPPLSVCYSVTRHSFEKSRARLTRKR